MEQRQQTHHADEQPRLLSGTPYTSVTDNANGETGSKTSKANRQTGTELDEALEEGHLHSDCMISVSISFAGNRAI